MAAPHAGPHRALLVTAEKPGRRGRVGKATARCRDSDNVLECPSAPPWDSGTVGRLGLVTRCRRRRHCCRRRRHHRRRRSDRNAQSRKFRKGGSRLSAQLTGPPDWCDRPGGAATSSLCTSAASPALLRVKLQVRGARIRTPRREARLVGLERPGAGPGQPW